MDSGGGFSTFGLNSYNSTRRGNDNDWISCYNLFWLNMPAALCTIRIQASERNQDGNWLQAMILYTDIGESLAI